MRDEGQVNDSVAARIIKEFEEDIITIASARKRSCAKSVQNVTRTKFAVQFASECIVRGSVWNWMPRHPPIYVGLTEFGIPFRKLATNGPLHCAKVVFG